jgi:tetratricopeptide (TPR) repeat protein
MHRKWVLPFVLAHIAGFTGMAAAQTLDQQRCAASDPDLSIRGCTAVIQSGQETQENLAVAFYHRGLAYDDKGQYDRAIEDYDQAIRLNSNYAQAFKNRGTDYNDKGQYDRAIKDLDQAIRLDPNYAVAFNNRGEAYRSKGQYDRAIEDFDQAIRLNPNDAQAFNNRGAAYGQKGQYGPAIEERLLQNAENARIFADFRVGPGASGIHP